MVFFGLSAAGRAEDGEPRPAVRGAVSAGLGGYYRIGRCLPLQVTLENSGPDVSGSVEFEIGGSLYRHDVSLPAPSRKSVALYAEAPQGLRDVEAVLFDGGRPVAEYRAPVQRIPEAEFLHVISSSLKPAYPQFGADLPGSPVERRVFIDPGDLPESWVGYAAADAVSLDASDASILSEAQRQALSRWVLLGGNVSLVSWDGAGIKGWGTPSSGLQPGGSKDSGQALTATPHGLGTFRISPSHTPPGFLSPERGLGTGRPALAALDRDIFQVLAIRQPFSRGSLVWRLGAFLFFYAVTVAAVWYRRRHSRLEKVRKLFLAPAVAVLFSLLAPALGALASGGKVAVRQCSVIHIFPGAADAFTASRLFIVSPFAAGYRFRPAADSAYLVQDRREGSGTAKVYRFEGKSSPSAEIGMNLWDMKVFDLESFSPGANIWAQERQDSMILANRSRLPLDGCMLLRNGGVTLLGDILPGKDLSIGPGIDAAGAQSSEAPAEAEGIVPLAVEAYRAETLSGALGDCVVCGFQGLIPGLAPDEGRFLYSGSTAVVFHLGRVPDRRDAKADR